VLVHVSAAPKRHLWDKDQVLNRMLPRLMTKK
jgi:cytochrome b561